MRLGSFCAIGVWVGVAVLPPTEPLAMELKVVGNQLILSGRVVGDEPGKVREALGNQPEIDIVILRNSPGGDAPAGYQTGQLLRERGVRTAVSGYCYSSCSRMFLGGSARYFTDDYLPEQNNIGFHGHYDRMEHLNANLVRQYGLRDWIIKYSDGKADPSLVERWINIPSSRGMIHFFHPGLVKRAGVSTFMCQGASLRARYLPVSRLTRQRLTSGSSRRWTPCTAPIVELAHRSEALLRALDHPLHSRFRRMHDCVKQAMTGNGGIESRANGFAISNAFRQSRVKLSDIVTRVGRDPLRNPAVFAWYGQLSEFLRITSIPSHIQFLPLHRGPRGGRQLEVALVPVDLEQE